LTLFRFADKIVGGMGVADKIVGAESIADIAVGTRRYRPESGATEEDPKAPASRRHCGRREAVGRQISRREENP
jgi:hypothetical protein